MTEAETKLLSEIKASLGITGTFQDATLLRKIKDVQAFMLSSGIRTEVIESDASVGVITSGVIDLMALTGGEIKFSLYFTQRLIQLAVKPETVV